MRLISDVARDIRKDWKKVNYATAPYLDAMMSLGTGESTYGADSAKSIVLYFLNNASSYRGDVARGLKAELKQIVGVK